MEELPVQVSPHFRVKERLPPLPSTAPDPLLPPLITLLTPPPRHPVTGSVYHLHSPLKIMSMTLDKVGIL